MYSVFHLIKYWWLCIPPEERYGARHVHQSGGRNAGGLEYAHPGERAAPQAHPSETNTLGTFSLQQKWYNRGEDHLISVILLFLLPSSNIYGQLTVQYINPWYSLQYWNGYCQCEVYYQSSYWTALLPVLLVVYGQNSLDKCCRYWNNDNCSAWV